MANRTAQWEGASWVDSGEIINQGIDAATLPDNTAGASRIYEIGKKNVGQDIKFEWNGRQITMEEIANELDSLKNSTKEGYFWWNGQQIHVGDMAQRLKDLESELEQKKMVEQNGQDLSVGDIVQSVYDENEFGKVTQHENEWQIYVKWLISSYREQQDSVESYTSIKKAVLDKFVLALQEQQSSSDNPVKGDLVTLATDESVFGRISEIQISSSVLVEWEINPNFSEPSSKYYHIDDLKKASMRQFVLALQEQQDEMKRLEREEREFQLQQEREQINSQVEALNNKLQWEKDQLLHELRFHQKKTLSMEEQFAQAMRRIEELERKGNEQEEIRRLEQEEILPVLASAPKRSVVRTIVHMAKEMGKQFVIKEIVRVAQANGLNLDWLFKLIGF